MGPAGRKVAAESGVVGRERGLPAEEEGAPNWAAMTPEPIWSGKPGLVGVAALMGRGEGGPSRRQGKRLVSVRLYE